VIAAAFRDKTAKAGVSYTYTVTALDASGNESKPSGEVIEKLP
jgi:fibronectin type 3 domain-containing protein